MPEKSITIALAGNPNAGKSTIFNNLTGTRQKVGNWPGVTVEKKEGHLKTNGYDLTVAGGQGKAASHPVQNVTWYECVKWCNARSEQEQSEGHAVAPVYYTTAGKTNVFRTGEIDITSDCVDWAGTGYRLPTDRQWEYAARGGLSGKRFAWGDTIDHTRANYVASYCI